MTALVLLLALAGIERVVVYPDRAEIVRVERASCRDGLALATFAELPATTDERTLRAAARDAEVVGVTLRTLAQAAVAVPVELARTRAQLAERDAELAALAERARLLAEYTTLLEGRLATDMGSAKPDLARWRDALDQLQAERKSRARREVAARSELRELARRVEALELNLALPAAPARRSAEVALRCTKDVEVRLSYVAGGASWVPEYDLRVTPGKQPRAELTTSVVVRQSTGEPWNDVQLVLATARPQLGADAPEPLALEIDGGPGDEAKVAVQTVEHRPRALGAGAGAHEEPLSLAQRVSVRADGRPHWLQVDTRSADATLHRVAAPSVRPHVYEVVRLPNPSGRALLPGRVRAYRAGAYVGDATLERKGPGEPLEISLGADEAVQLRRSDLEHLREEPGLLGKTRRLHRGHRVKLVNETGARVEIELREPVPVSAVEDIAVELDRKRTSAGFTHDAVRGRLVWTLAFEPGQQREIDLVYAIALPADWVLP